MPSILVISFVEWAGAYQRPQHLADRLAARGWRVTYASPGYLHRRGRRVASGLELPAGLRVIEPAALPGASRWSAVAALNDWWMARKLRGLTREPWDTIVFNDPRFAGLAATLPARRRIFDCMDDLTAQSPSARVAERRLDRALEAADRVWTGTPSLKERLKGRHAHLRFVAGGVDAERFANPDPAEIEAARVEVHSLFSGHPSPIPDFESPIANPQSPISKSAAAGPLAGYFGVLNERVDMRLIEALLASGPWRVLLIGPSTSRVPRLPDNPRLRRLGPRPYAALPAYLALFDLALIPYDTHGPHRFLYPVKALEYLAGGKPVLASPLPDLEALLGSYLELADGPAAWREGGRRLLVDRSAAQARARAGRAAACRTWDAMLDEMLADLTIDD
jgi:glycosyltransferase involved in cell wall biosynthesis